MPLPMKAARSPGAVSVTSLLLLMLAANGPMMVVAAAGQRIGPVSSRVAAVADRGLAKPVPVTETEAFVTVAW